MRDILEQFLADSTPDQLRAELAKGNRPFLQTLDEPEWVCPIPEGLPPTLPATVSFFRGHFAEEQVVEESWGIDLEMAANAELALAG